ncbi:dihydroneopterin aldolase [Planococcus shenhongbingii]|uniref:7,8-dihydroneopterin aldolase n=1 Tax=Planococcus shenhongbingii TaxID=3058398 RepID=A0ABT8NI84_9BACL|nr:MULTISPECIES: dihydroneopterin aldolase [unclassified Planococcus (in: firmicutes)]MDN7247551.1 dihydroneopterin aldolase [Planococcus sp. N017]WKA58671.1 dihydroneopterin aldolase [Planococcus sp. N016]
MDFIHVNDMEFYGYHGVFPEETKLGQRFRMTVSLAVDLKIAGETDDLKHTVHYGEVYEACKAIVEGEPKKLVEAVAEEVTARLLTQFPLVKGVRVQLIKPDPPIPGHYKSVAIELTRGEFA